MSKINERRERTGKQNIENKATISDASVKKTEFPYKKILIIALAVVAVIACALLIVNAVIESYAAKFRNGTSVDGAVIIDKQGPDDSEVLYNSELRAEELAKYDFLVTAFDKVNENYAVQSTNVLSKDGVYNFVISVNDDDLYAGIDENNKLATVVLVSINNGNIKMVRMNPSSLVVIPGKSVGPLYDSYRFGNAALLAKTIQQNYGIKVNGYIDLSLDAFMTVATEISGGNGIELPGKNKDEIHVYGKDDANALVDYIKKSDDKEAMIQKVVESVAGNLSSMKIIELKGTVKAITGMKDGMVAYISRKDFGNLINLGTKVLASGFNAENDLTTFGIEDASAITQNAVGNYYTYSTPNDYLGAVNALQSKLGLE